MDFENLPWWVYFLAVVIGGALLRVLLTKKSDKK